MFTFPSYIKSLHISASFLTRFPGPRKIYNDQIVASSIYFYTLIGLILGLSLVLPFYLGLFKSFPLLQAWLLLILSIWVTRALHWDGLADVADAAGSLKHGVEFQEILKDSRIGAFGVIALIASLSGQLISLWICLSNNLYSTVIFGYIISRCVPIVLLYFCPLSPCSRLTRQVASITTIRPLAVNLIPALAIGIIILPLHFFLISISLCTLVILYLSKLSHRNNGINGDFIGAGTNLCELVVFLTPSILL